MQYVKAANVGEIQEGGKKKITANGKVLLLANIDGKYYAIDNKCTHMGGSLYDGDMDADNIICPRHGTVFSIRTGEVVSQGKLLFMNVKADAVKSYGVKVEGDEILVGI